jgi:hypothetical protein
LDLSGAGERQFGDTEPAGGRLVGRQMGAAEIAEFGDCGKLAAPGWMARVLRFGAYAAVLVLTLAKASVEQVRDNPAALPRLSSDASVPVTTGMIYTWLVESLFLLVVGVYVTAILAATARRPRVAPATLAAGAGAGIALGAVMYAVAPLGLASLATDPWLHGLPIGMVVLLVWVLLFGGPMLAGVVAARCYRGPGSREQVYKARIRQAVAAGFLATAVGAVMVTVLGTVTIALEVARTSDRYVAVLFLGVVTMLFLLAALAGLAGAWLLPGAGDPEKARLARGVQGLLAGSVAGAVCGLLLTNFFVVAVVMMIIGPVVGAAGGTVGGFAAADHPLRSRPARSWAAGVFVRF